MLKDEPIWLFQNHLAACSLHWLLIRGHRHHLKQHELLSTSSACMCFAGQWWGHRPAVVSDSASPRNLELMLLGWPGRLTPRARWYARLHPLRVLPPQYRAATMVAEDVWPWLHSPLVSISGSLPLCCTLWCVLVNVIHAFPFPFKPSCCYWKLWFGAVYDQILLAENSSFVCLLLLLPHIIRLL
jgi:hypothetical protein